jgi:hypothetical protein
MLTPSNAPRFVCVPIETGQLFVSVPAVPAKVFLWCGRDDPSDTFEYNDVQNMDRGHDWTVKDGLTLRYSMSGRPGGYLVLQIGEAADVRCGACDRPIQGWWRFCPSCGQPIRFELERLPDPGTPGERA